MLALGITLYALRDFIAFELISIVLADIFVVSSAVCLYIGILRFLGQRENRLLVITVMLVFVIALCNFTYVAESITLRSAVLSLALAVMCLATVRPIWLRKPRSIASSANFVGTILLFIGGFFAFRTVGVFFAQPLNGLFDLSVLQILTFGVAILLDILLVFGLMMMVNQLLNAKISQARDHFENIFNTGPDAAVISRINDGRIIDINQGFSLLFGFTREEVIGKSALELDIWDNPEDRSRMIDILKENGAVVNQELVLRRKDGCEISASVSAKTIILEDTPHLISITRDISSTKLAALALMESQALTKAIVESTSDLIWSVDPSTFGLLTLNHSLSQYFLKERSLVIRIGMPPEELFPTRDISDQWRAYYQKALTEGSFATEYLDYPGRATWELTFNLLKRDGQVFGISVIGVDITLRKQAAEKLKLSSERLAALYEKEKLQRQELQEEAKSRGLLIDILGHELRTPLTPVMACSGMLREILYTQNNEIEKKLIKNICAGTDSLSLKLEELLDLAKFSRGTFKLYKQAVDVEFLFNQTVAKYARVAEQQTLRLVFDAAPDLPMIQADRIRLAQVLDNLLSNAIKYSLPNTAITLRARTAGSNLIFEFQDQGIGISIEDQKKLLDPYHRVQQDTHQVPGIGLGFTVSRHIVEAHGGKIWITSQLGQGSTFFVELPIGEAPKDTKSNSEGMDLSV